ncbi:unnamed protein product [Tuber melanosporum]|uniref:(Perigord truffle) hypothetical protein n=1 Tax=Tuber melanosporum (strain Mel28) TaxID=656061 RepID=D5GIC7_TUBMM|nr:uncharacterized protein GSTUM_00008427001 [Tuber melanosporum]CAZ84270.1 unnamed protein product [Tuber melanosporum]
MGIQALPDTAVRALGSGQVLTDPVSLIKELLDNSLDALATAISIEVSQNTLDVLQVKDNGHGIPTEDREFVAMRHCTSKITDFEEIQDCRSLGFRGEALASAAELAGGLVITTMVEGEKVAMACTCDRVGKVTARKPVGAMKGTTVRVTDFFKFLPVRRENAIKGAQKSLSKVRTLLQRYYLSHPACRFSLRVLAPPQKSKAAGGQSEDIVYAPSKSVSEAVMKAVGKEIVATCQWINTEHEEVTDGSGEQKIGIEAFMPKPGSDPAIICRKPQCTNFVFVDSRPVSCARGTLKQILSLYKSYLKSALPDSAISDPFLYLNLRCPPGAYDPNIEPAKDDVMFFHADRVIGAVEVIFKGLYGELKTKSSPGGSGGKGKSVEMMTGGFELLLARKRDPKPGTTKPPEAPEIDEDEEEMAAQQVNMMMELDEDPPAAGLTPANPGKAPPVQTREESPHRSHNRDGSVRPPMFSITDAPSPGSVRPGELNQEPTPPAAPLAQMVQTPRRRPTNWGFNMSSGYDEDESDLVLDEVERQVRSDLAEEQADEAAARDIAISNPWTAAKMNSPASGSNQPFSPAIVPSIWSSTVSSLLCDSCIVLATDDHNAPNSK